MIDVDKQVDYWRSGAREDWAVGTGLVDNGRVRHDLFFARLALDKALKALVSRHTRDLPPRIHNLGRLVELAGLDPSADHRNALAEMTSFNIDGRYPDTLAAPPNKQEAQRYLARAERVFEWLMTQ